MSNVKDMDALLKRFVDEGLPGCGCKVVQRGKTLYEGYFGYQDPDAGKKTDANSVYRLASMSKIPMYTVCMMLYERGVFNLTDPVYEYLPEWENLNRFEVAPNGDLKVVPCKKKLTVGDILSMKCGLPYCNSPAPTTDPTLTSMQEIMKPLWERGHYTNAEQVAAMSKAVLAAEPGERWIYGFSSEIAVALIEKIMGKGIDDVMKEFLFDPLEMKDTRSRFFGDIESRMVKLIFAGPNDTPHFNPAKLDEKHIPGPEHEQGWARLFSTVEDFSHLMQMLAEGGAYKGKQIVGRRTIDMMRSNGLSSSLRVIPPCTRLAMAMDTA